MSSGSAIGESFACAPAIQAVTYSYNFQEGSIVFSVEKAKKGILEKLVVKIVKIVVNKKTQGQVVVLYIDTLNGLWNENELCSFNEAKAFAVEYLENYQLALQNALANC